MSAGVFQANAHSLRARVGVMDVLPRLPLTDGASLPSLGLGTYGLTGAAGVDAIREALVLGYRLVDTAMNYGNEREVGEALRASGVDREEVVVTSKLPGRHHGYDETVASVEQSRQALGLDTIDLYLIHWPLPRVNRYLESWRAMIDLRERGVLRSIGVSNFTQEHLARLIDETGVPPVVNQVELHPYFPQQGLRSFHDEHGIVTESWSPLARKRDVASEPVVQEVAAAHGITPMQAVLRWHVQLGAVPIPKSASAKRQRENLDIFDVELTDTEVDAISALESGRIGGDPEVHEEM